MANWPGTLPQSFLVDGFSLTKQKGADNNQTDVGPTISRQRFTATSRFFTGRMFMTPTQFATLESFYRDTLFQGSTAFTWVHPLTNAVCQMRFDLSKEDDYAIEEVVTPLKWRIVVSLEILPS